MGEAQNAATAREAYEAFNRGDVERLSEIFADVVWHIPGQSRIAGDKKGWADIGPFFATMGEITAGDFRGDVEEVFAKGDRVITLHTTHGSRPDGTSRQSRSPHLAFRGRSGG